MFAAYSQPSIQQRSLSVTSTSYSTLPARTMLRPTATATDMPTTSDTSPSTTAVSFVRPHLLKLAPYTPIEPFEVLSAKLGRAPEDIIKLDANENPYGPPPEVREALGNMQFPNIYPDPESRALRAGLAQYCGIPDTNILVGCGADELIDLLMRCVLDPGDSILDCPPTFGMYTFDAAVNDAHVITVPRKEDFSIDTPAILDAIATQKPKVVFLTSPNNPDGSTIDEASLLAILDQPVLVVLDEAYIEFSGQPTRMPWVLTRPNLIVLRTFSKMAGLAGIRVGYGAFPDGLIDYIWRAKQPYNVSVAAEVAALAALSNMPYLEGKRDALVAERDRLFSLLQDVPYLQPYPSQSNFILCKVLDRDALGVKDALAQRGIMVRHYAKKDLSNYVRISVGLPEHTDAVVAALKDMA